MPERVATASRPRSREYARPVGRVRPRLSGPFKRQTAQRLARLGLKQLEYRIVMPRADQVIDVMDGARLASPIVLRTPLRGASIAMPSDCDATGIMIQSESGE